MSFVSEYSRGEIREVISEFALTSEDEMGPFRVMCSTHSVAREVDHNCSLLCVGNFQTCQEEELFEERKGLPLSTRFHSYHQTRKFFGEGGRGFRSLIIPFPKRELGDQLCIILGNIQNYTRSQNKI